MCNKLTMQGTLYHFICQLTCQSLIVQHNSQFALPRKERHKLWLVLLKIHCPTNVISVVIQNVGYTTVDWKLIFHSGWKAVSTNETFLSFPYAILSNQNRVTLIKSIVECRIYYIRRKSGYLPVNVRSTLHAGRKTAFIGCKNGRVSGIDFWYRKRQVCSLWFWIIFLF